MGSNYHFKNFGNEPPGEGGSGGGGKQLGNFGLPRQPSIYSLTFDEVLSSTGGSGKDFGSMNTDELLKNIWNAEENQTIGGPGVNGQEVGVPGGNLQRQGSLTLPRTLSHKTVDEVWRDMSKEHGGGKDGNSVGVPPNIPQTQRQQTLREITLEEFLVRAGVVREDAQFAAKSNNAGGIFGDLSYGAPMAIPNNTGLAFGYQQANNRNTCLMAGSIPNKNGETVIQTANLPLNVNGVRSTQQQLRPQQLQQNHQPQQQQPQQQPIFPKQPALPYGAPMAIPNSGQLGSPGMRGGMVGIPDPALNSNFIQGASLMGGGMNMVGLGASGVTVATASPGVSSSDGLGKSNGDTPSVSPVPYVFNGGLRGRKYSTVEKVVERRQRRMIKNRESAARSRARKQAYTMELEAEVAKLKEENDELQKKQEEMLEMQKNQVMEMMNLQKGAKRRCLRRTQTGPW